MLGEWGRRLRRFCPRQKSSYIDYTTTQARFLPTAVGAFLVRSNCVDFRPDSCLDYKTKFREKTHVATKPSKNRKATSSVDYSVPSLLLPKPTRHLFEQCSPLASKRVGPRKHGRRVYGSQSKIELDLGVLFGAVRRNTIFARLLSKINGPSLTAPTTGESQVLSTKICIDI